MSLPFEQDRLNGEEATLRAILAGTAAETGDRFFSALVRNVALALQIDGAWVTEYLRESNRLRALAFWFKDKYIDEYEYDLRHTPCESVIADRRFVHYPTRLIELFPNDPDLGPMSAVSYMGAPLLDLDGSVLGHLAALDTKKMPHQPRLEWTFKIFADRAAAELRRMRVQEAVEEREDKLSRLVGSAMDAIIEIDDRFVISQVNRSAETFLSGGASDLVGLEFSVCLAPASAEKLRSLTRELTQRDDGQRYLWIPGGLTAVRLDGKPFEAEASLSHYRANGRGYFTLILRDVEQQREAERRLHSLTNQTAYLTQEIQFLQNFGDIIGTSAALRRVLADVRQVADTDASVLIRGETGTGKELVARAIHAESRRGDGPMVTINCAAIPASLIESELFGHEKGAFTGATAKRDGRFAIADGGTIFLDEVGDLPRELQPKLLRVLQEGTFEPVGGSRTCTVDVRVIAATNRNLEQAASSGDFREDLYYRLNVFPITLPPLRERREDIGALAEAFTMKYAGRTGRTVEPPSPADIRRLNAYDWPGNVRELQNVIERAVITSTDGRLNLDRALPTAGAETPRETLTAPDSPSTVLTVNDMLEFERENILRALEACNWKIAGATGAAHMLGMPPSTLNSRLKALGIKRP
jgi:PAS domain S-box-containing protein